MSLSIRIFSWFWISVIAVAALTFAWSRGDYFGATPLTDEQTLFVQKQAERIESQWRGKPNLQWLGKRNQQTQGTIWWVYDSQTSMFLGERTPKSFHKRVEEWLTYTSPFLFRHDSNWLIGPIHLNVGLETTRYQLFIGLPPHLTRGLYWQQLLRNTPFLLIAVVLLLGLISYLVARQIAKPLESLRNTARQIADGDFKANVEVELLKRKDEIGNLAQTVSQMGKTIDKALVAHKRLLSDVSHELRSPLTRLSLANSLMAKRLGTHPESTRIEQEVSVLNGMIEQLLNLSRMQLTPEQERRPFALRPLLKLCMDDAEFSYPDLNINLIDDIESAVDVQVRGNEELLCGAVHNVINNASRYAKSCIQIRLQQVEQDWLLTIADDGEGVPASELDKLFVPFYRPEFSRQRDKGGIGLGLAIVEQAVKFHGGVVKAKRSELGGLAVEMRLPTDVEFRM